MPRCPSAANTLLRAAARLLGLRFSPHTIRPSRAPTQVKDNEGCKNHSRIWLTCGLCIGVCTSVIRCKLQCKHNAARRYFGRCMNSLTVRTRLTACVTAETHSSQTRLAMNRLKASTKASACTTCKVTQQHPVSKGVLQQRGSLVS